MADDEILKDVAEDTPMDEEELENVERAQESMVCPKCGWPVGMPITANITDDDKDAFLNAVLFGNNWIKEISRFGNRLIFRFRSRKASEGEAINSMLVERYGMAPYSPEKIKFYYDIALIFSLVSITIGSEEMTFPTPEAVTLDGLSEIYKDMFGNMDDSILCSARDAFIEFENCYQVLIRRSYDPNFWESAAQPSEN